MLRWGCTCLSGELVFKGITSWKRMLLCADAFRIVVKLFLQRVDHGFVHGDGDALFKEFHG